MNIQKIIKRDGRVVDFCEDRITNAITKASNNVIPSDEIMSLTTKVCELVGKETNQPTVEQIQDAVETILMNSGYTDIAKAYILYRSERTRVRDMDTQLMRDFKKLTFLDSKDNDAKRENANIDGNTSMGTMLKYGSTAAREFDKLYVLPREIADAHENGDIHIHDMDFYTMTTTCTQIDLSKLFKKGFSTGHGYLRTPNSIASYSALACIAIQSNQNDQHGGQSIPKFDYDMAQGVRKTYAHLYKENIYKAAEIYCDYDYDFAKSVLILSETPTMNDQSVDDFVDSIYTSYNVNYEQAAKIEKFARKNALIETERATYQAMEALIHNLNTMNSRAGAQVPFSSINYGTDTSPEGRMVVKNLLLAEKAGLGNGETPIFPIHIFKVKDGINYNKDDPNYDLFKLACEVSAKRLFPNFSFIDAPYNLQYYKEGNPDTEIAYMGCRTRVIGNTYDPSREIVTGRGNLSFTSINLPRLGIESNGNVEEFFVKLDDLIDLCIKQLLHRFKIQGSKKVKNFPFLMGQGVWMDSENLSSEDTLEEVLKHGTLSIGFIGLAECLKALIGKHHGESEEAQELGLKIIDHMRKRMDEESEKTGLNFSLLATPAEGLSGRFVRIDAKKYGIIEGVTDREYYTNSFHVPVYYNINAFNKIKIEAPYHELTNAGHISYIELDGDPLTNLSAFEKIVRCMKESGIGYGAINHPVDCDPICGYSGVIGDECPHCHRKEFFDSDGNRNNIAFDRIRRITGYLVGTLDRFNDAKLAEVNDRIKHNI